MTVKVKGKRMTGISRNFHLKKVHKEFGAWLFSITTCFVLRYMRVAPKVIPPILLCWSTISEVDISGMVAEV